ncbi:hypothetical protein [Streptomyces sp. NBC_00878]|uniref:hypothetical protein n=1 Tax=Streptomyces sp. NBC_00878 TaxID=2975854 RepID=UPI00224E1D90|nr:hypothetical protein [Streptomyces sp. NBC_00878]MCX4911878.1 hypothetical protein [Streptomyces sp. NBC_00878]
MSSVAVPHRSARAHMQYRRRRLMAIGQWESPLVDAAPVRAHVRALGEAGMSQPALVRRLNLPPSALKNLMYGANGRPPGQKVLRETAQAVLAYWPVMDDLPDTALIDVTGTLRRVQALETLGWSKPEQAAEVGLLRQNFKACLRRPVVSVRFARRVAGLYDRLWTQMPEDRGVPEYVADRVRRNAVKQEFHGPLAWDDDTIDDPKAGPVADVVGPVVTEGGNVADRWLLGESVSLGRADRRKVLQHLFEWTNDTTVEIADRLEMTPSAAERQWERIKEKAALEGQRVWRRVYVPRERDLRQNEMGEAA